LPALDESVSAIQWESKAPDTRALFVTLSRTPIAFTRRVRNPRACVCRHSPRRDRSAILGAVSIDEAKLWAAYSATKYVVPGMAAQEVAIVIGQRTPRLDALLDGDGHACWCFVTAWNPGSQPLGQVENEVRNAGLRARLEAEGFTCLPGEGRGQAAEWPPEASFLVLGLPLEQGVAVGREEGQIAIVYGERGGTARLVDCRARKNERG